MSYDDENEVIILGNVTDPGHDYWCDTCSELFEVHYRRDNRPAFVVCPVCGSGKTRKLIVAPATTIWWRNAKASSDAAEMAPKFRGKSVSRSREKERRP